MWVGVECSDIHNGHLGIIEKVHEDGCDRYCTTYTQLLQGADATNVAHTKQKLHA